MTLEPDRIKLPRFIKHVEYFPTVDSTNDAARRLAPNIPRQEGLLVIAENQTAGRGRGTNRWFTGRGSLAFSVLIDPSRFHIETRYCSVVPLAAAAAVVDCTNISFGWHVGIHWPNDVFVREKKLAGTLVETLSDGRQIIGLGVNVNNSMQDAPPEIARIATALIDEREDEEQYDRTGFLTMLLESLSNMLKWIGQDRMDFIEEMNEVLLQRDQVLNVQVGEERVTGVCVGLADDGALTLKTDAGTRTIYSGVVIK